MSIRSILDGGIRLMRTQPKVMAIWTAINIAFVMLMALGTQPFRASMAAAQQQAAANAAAGIRTAPGLPPGQFGLVAISNLGVFALAIIGFAAVVRAIVRPTGDRFAYLRVGMDELRLLGLGVLLILIILLAEIVALIGIGVLVTAAMAVLGRGSAVLVGAILGIVLFGAIIYAQVRISLAGALTVMRQRIVLKEAWRVTKGQFWTLFGAYILMAMGYTVITIVIVAITHPEITTVLAQPNPQAMQAAALAMDASSELSAAHIAGLILTAIVVAISAVIIFGGITTAALELSGMDASIADEF